MEPKIENILTDELTEYVWIKSDPTVTISASSAVVKCSYEIQTTKIKENVLSDVKKFIAISLGSLSANANDAETN